MKQDTEAKLYSCGAGIYHIEKGNAIEKINNSPIEKIFVTDTHPFDKKDSKKIKTIAILWD